MTNAENKLPTLKQRRRELPREVVMARELRKASSVLNDAANLLERGHLKGCAYSIAVVHKFLTELSNGGMPT